jgi:effector-binding domain-containing protein
METKTIPTQKYFTYSCTTTLAKLNELAAVEVDQVYQESQNLGFELTGPVQFIYFDCSSDIHKPFTLFLALPIVKEKDLKSNKYSLKEFDEFKCVSHIHQGPLKDLYSVYGNLFENLYKSGAKPGNQIREVYKKFVEMDSPENITEIQIGIV